MHLKDILKSNKSLLYLLSIIYSFPVILKNIKWIIKGNLKIRGTFLRRVKFHLTDNSRIVIGKGAILERCIFHCKGVNAIITIDGQGTRIKETTFYCEDNDSRIDIRRDFSMESGHIASTEGKRIVIEDDCMFSNDVEIRNGDSHPILHTGTNIRINYADDIRIGRHVWLCAHVRIMKGTIIPYGCIIGNSTVLKGILKESNSIYAGSSGKIVRSNIMWKRDRYNY